ncbi:MAG: hypothetical protein U5N55_12335 [Cypionkella sp.]|nr:hypothetical protein [Cypionkella sp.]
MTKFTPLAPRVDAAKNLHIRAQTKRLPRRFLGDESGAVTIDWVVLAAAMVGLVGTTFASLSPVVITKIGTIFN